MTQNKYYNLVDIFGINIGLRYLNEEQYRTRFGAFATLFIAAFIIIQIIFVGSELVLKEKPDVIFSERFVEKPERYNFKPDIYNFAFGAQYPGNYTHFIDPSIYTVSAEQLAMKKVYNKTSKSYDQVWTSTSIPYHRCTEEDFKVKQSYNYFTKLSGIENMYCLDLTNYDLFIEGNFDQDSFGTIQIKFQLCDPKTSSVKCRDDLNEILTNSFVAYYFNDVIVNPKDYYPFQKIGRDAFWNASPLFPKDATMYYRNIYVESDKGILFEDKMFERSTALSYQDQQIIFGESNYYFSLTIRFEKSKETVYHRKYKKIDSLLAEIGGVAKALMIIGIIMFQPMNKLNLHSNLANSLFTFNKEEEQQNENINQRQGKLTELIEVHRQKTFLRSKSVPMISPSQQNDEENREDQFQQDICASNIKVDSTPKNPQNFIFNAQTKVQFSTNLDREDSYREKQMEAITTPQAFLNHDNGQTPFFSTQKQAKPQNGIKNSVNLLEIIKERNRIMESSKIPQQPEQQKQEPTFQKEKLKQNKPLRKRGSSNASENIKKVFKQEKQSEQLELKWTDYIKYYIWPFGRFQKKKQQIDYSIELIYKHLDMLYIVKKLLELEKLKQLLLNDDQIKLIQFFPKPYIDIKQIESNKFNQRSQKKKHEVNILNNPNEKSEKQKAVEAFKALQNIISKPYLSDIDKKIIEMLDGSILENIENNEDYLKEIQESIDLDDNQNKETERAQLDMPLQTLDRNYTQHYQEPILEISDTQSIKVKRLQKPNQMNISQQQEENQKSDTLTYKGNYQSNQQINYEIDNLQNNQFMQPQQKQQIDLLKSQESNYNQQISQTQLPIIKANHINIEIQQLKEKQNEQHQNQELIKFEDAQSIYSE